METMAATAQTSDEEWYETRLARAQNETITLTVVGPNDFAVEGDSGDAHILETSGVDALHCTCPDLEHNLVEGQKCKHMIAYEEWEVDEVQVPD